MAGPRLPRPAPGSPSSVSSLASRLSGRFPDAEEAVYHELKFDELRRFSQRTFLSLPLLIVGLWVWDWAIDPAAAPGTLTLRFGMAACLVPCILALRNPRVGLKGFTVLLYTSVLATEVFWLAILRRLDGGLVYGIGGYMYYVLGILLVGLPLRFRDNVVGLSVALMVPNAAAVLGILPGFSYAKYNALIIPAGALSLFTFWAFDRLYRRTYSYQRAMEQLAGEDALTGLANRRHFMLAGEQLLAAVHRYGRPGSLLVLDLDFFKAVNDRYGHAAGDVALQATARLLTEHQRESDLAARLGGEEFAMLLPETDLAGAGAVAERLRAACESLSLEVPGGALTGMHVTMSIGVAACGADDKSLDDVLRRADAALYRAKHGGRNRVEVA